MERTPEAEPAQPDVWSSMPRYSGAFSSYVRTISDTCGITARTAPLFLEPNDDQPEMEHGRRWSSLRTGKLVRRVAKIGALEADRPAPEDRECAHRMAPRKNAGAHCCHGALHFSNEKTVERAIGVEPATSGLEAERKNKG